MGNGFISEVSTLQQGNVRQDVWSPSSSPTAPTPILGNLVSSKAKLLLFPMPTTSLCGYIGSTRSHMPVCQMHHPSFSDKLDSVGLGSFV